MKTRVAIVCLVFSLFGTASCSYVRAVLDTRKENIAKDTAARDVTKVDGDKVDVPEPSSPTKTLKQAADAADANNVNPVYDSNWVTHVALGAQFLPDYDEEGRSSGLSKQQFFGLLTVDGRFGENRADTENLSLFRSPNKVPFHAGVTVALLGTPIKREDKPSVAPTEFNDVAQTIVSSIYAFSPTFYSSKKDGHNLGPIARVGVVSRETLGNRGDSVNWFYSLGIQYSSMRFMNPEFEATEDGKLLKPKNGVPEGYIRLSAARFEDYAGLGTKTRLVADAALRIYPAQNMFLGIQGNFGQGPDEFMLVVSLVRQPKEIANLFTLGKAGTEEKARN